MLSKKNPEILRDNLYSFLRIIEKMKDYIEIDAYSFINNLATGINLINDVVIFKMMHKIYPKEFNCFMKESVLQ